MIACLLACMRGDINRTVKAGLMSVVTRFCLEVVWFGGWRVGRGGGRGGGGFFLRRGGLLFMAVALRTLPATATVRHMEWGERPTSERNTKSLWETQCITQTNDSFEDNFHLYAFSNFI